MKYTLEISFDTDRTLTETELDQLIAVLESQIAEPADEFGDDAEFTTNDIRIETKGDLI